MENASPPEEHNIHEFFKKLIFERDQKIAALEKQLEQAVPAPADSVLSTKLANAQKDLENLKNDNANQSALYQRQIKNLNEVVQKMRDDYQLLRRAKGGFGFLSMLACFGVASVLGLGAGWLLFKQKEPQAAVFQKYKDANQFNFEYDISQGRFDNIEASLKKHGEAKEYALIKEEIEFLKKIMGASKRKFQDAGLLAANVDGFAVQQTPDDDNVQEKANKTLTITEPTATLRSEASTNGDKLGKLNKGQTVGVWDRTYSLDKITLTIEGNKCEISDYWYKVEPPGGGAEGWVFGYFTNRSLNRVIIIGEPIPASEVTPPAVRPDKPLEKPSEKKPDENKPDGQ